MNDNREMIVLNGEQIDELVRCKDCFYYIPEVDDPHKSTCQRLWGGMTECKADSYCSDGVRGRGRRMKCAYCKYNDGAAYPTNPPKYRCTVTGEYHLALDDCNMEFAPVKHGWWVKRGDNSWECSVCHEISCCNGNYCVDCGARMDAQIGEDKSHPFAESVMMGMDGVEDD